MDRFDALSDHFSLPCAFCEGKGFFPGSLLSREDEAECPRCEGAGALRGVDLRAAELPTLPRLPSRAVRLPRPLPCRLLFCPQVPAIVGPAQRAQLQAEAPEAERLTDADLVLLAIEHGEDTALGMAVGL